MTDEEKKAAEAAEAEAQAKAQAEKEKADADFEAEIADLSDEEKEAKRAEKEANKIDKNNPDYEAELEKERQARIDAQKALAAGRYKQSEAKRKADELEEDLDEEEDDDKPLTKRELKEILAGQQNAILKETQSARIADIAKRISTSDSEARLTIEIHKNRQWPSSISLEQQLEEANAIANRKKIQSVNKELARALQGKDGVSKDSAGTYRDGMQGSAPKMSTGDTAAYKRAGFSFNTTNKLWQKKLPNGKILNKDPRTKRTFIS